MSRRSPSLLSQISLGFALGVLVFVFFLGAMS